MEHKTWMRQKRATTSKYIRCKTRNVPEAQGSRNQGKENGGSGKTSAHYSAQQRRRSARSLR